MRAVALLLCWVAVAAACPGQSTTLPPRDYRGTNYIPAMALTPDNFLSGLPYTGPGAQVFGFFVPEIVEAEIAKIAESGMNSIRVFPSFYAWVADRAAYMSALRTLAQICNLHGVKITYVVWSAIGLTSEVPSLDGVVSDELWHELAGSDPNAPVNFDVFQGAVLRDLTHHLGAVSVSALPVGEAVFGSMHLDPGNELIAASGNPTNWPYDLWRRICAYLLDVGTFFASDPAGSAAFGSYDLFNEPNGGAILYGIPIANYLQFIAATSGRLALHHPGAQTTIGWAGADWQVDSLDTMARAAGINCTYLSVHAYAAPEIMRQQLGARAAYAASLGIDVVVSEFYRTDVNAGQMAYLLDALQEHHAGGQMWCFLQSNVFSPTASNVFAPIDGIYVPWPHPTPVSAVTFEIVNPIDRAAVLAWGAGTLSPGPYSSVQVVDGAGTPLAAVTAGTSASVTVRSLLVGQPVFVAISFLGTGPLPTPCVSNLGPGCLLVPGAGFVYSNATTMIIDGPPIDATGNSVVIPAFTLPPSWAGMTMALQAYVGSGVPSVFAQHTGHLTTVSNWLLQ